jgi:hypothetical protein
MNAQSASTVTATLSSVKDSICFFRSSIMILLTVLCVFGLSGAQPTTGAALFDPGFDLHNDDTPDSITYDSIGNQSYDELFRQTAQITAQVQVLNSSLLGIDTAIDVPLVREMLNLSTVTTFKDITKTLKRGINDTGKVLATIVTVQVLQKAVPVLQDSIQSLLSFIATRNPVVNLTRYKSYLLGAATDALTSAKNSLNDDNTQLDGISARTNKLARKIVALFQSE